MTLFFSAAPSYCSRFGVAVLLVGLADFLFYGQPAGITVFLFAILIAAAVVAVHPAAFSDGRLWLKPAALLVALLPLAENVSPLSVSTALAALIVFALSLSGRLRPPHRSHCRPDRAVSARGAVPIRQRFHPLAQDGAPVRRAPRPAGGDRRLGHAADAGRCLPGAVRRRQPGHRLLAVADRPREAARSHPAGAAALLAGRARSASGPSCGRACRAFSAAHPAAARSGRRRRRRRQSQGRHDDRGHRLPARPPFLRALVVFNILFALQTALDAAYLWGGGGSCPTA